MSDDDEPDYDDFETGDDVEDISDEPVISERDQAIAEVLDRLGLDSINELPIRNSETVDNPSNVRGDVFLDVADALLFLAGRGLLDFSNIVDWEDGTFHVEIGDSPGGNPR